MVIVTGATGHIGNVLVRELLTAGTVVRALVLPDDDKRPLAGLNVEIVYGDVTDRESLKTAFAGAELVFHLAGIVTIMPGRRGGESRLFSVLVAQRPFSSSQSFRNAASQARK